MPLSSIHITWKTRWATAILFLGRRQNIPQVFSLGATRFPSSDISPLGIIQLNTLLKKYCQRLARRWNVGIPGDRYRAILIGRIDGDDKEFFETRSDMVFSQAVHDT
jgi:hypothetical protein